MVLEEHPQSFFASYMDNKVQCTEAAVIKSSFLSVTRSVPQGSVLTHSLFTIYQ